MSELAFEAAAPSLSPPGRSAPAADPAHTREKNGITYVFSGYMTKLLVELIPGTDKRTHRAWESLPR